jgi:hypothetical protein
MRKRRKRDHNKPVVELRSQVGSVVRGKEYHQDGWRTEQEEERQQETSAAGSEILAPRCMDICLEEARKIWKLLEGKGYKEQIKRRVTRAYKQREQRRHRKFEDFSERIRREERKRLKQERKRIPAVVKKYRPVAVDAEPGNGTFKEPVDHPDRTPTRAIQPRQTIGHHLMRILRVKVQNKTLKLLLEYSLRWIMGTEKENRPIGLDPERKARSNRNWGRRKNETRDDYSERSRS